MFGKPVDLSTLPLPPGVATNPTQRRTTAVPPKNPATEDDGPVKAGFSYVKRDLVRLLGISCAGEKAVQDRVRACGGIPVVMNLCVVDERNPCKSPEPYVYLDLPSSRPHCCASHLFIWPRGSSQALTPYNRFPDLREHAIFALHNLLEGNAENQRVVDQIRPLPRPPS
jgi:ataxin-10